MIRTILWDFDGVILDSMSVRDTGFAEIFKDYPKDKTDELLDYHRLNGGLSRYVKIKYFFNELLEETITEEKILEYAQTFSIIMRQKLTDKSLLIKETVDFIEKYHHRVPFHIVSGSDGQELRFLCKELKIAQYFITIDGSPTPKNELVNNLLKEYKYEQASVCLIGDSINDYEAAKENGVRFLGFNNTKLKQYSEIYLNTYEALEKELK